MTNAIPEAGAALTNGVAKPKLDRKQPSMSFDEEGGLSHHGRGTGGVRKGGTSIETTIFIVVALVLHALYLTTQTSSASSSGGAGARGGSIRGLFSLSRPVVSSGAVDLGDGTRDHEPRRPGPPELLIYRRTRKTGSSSMVNALLRALAPLGYEGVKEGEHEVEAVVRNEYVRPYPRRLFVVHHNQVTKAAHPLRRAAIADTVRDGFETITSYCRQKQRVADCERDAMVACLNSEETLAQIRYRFVNTTEENDETYIDLPLSSKHPGLSTSVMRTIFPNVTLHVDYYNVHDSKCNRSTVHPDIAGTYDALYRDFDEQTKTLQRRMLGIAGFPFVSDGKDVSLDEMLDAAEIIEAAKYDLPPPETVKGKPSEIIDLLKQEQIWERDRKGKLVLKKKRKSL